jgi:hypothetical protein
MHARTWGFFFFEKHTLLIYLVIFGLDFDLYYIFTTTSYRVGARLAGTERRT